LAGPMLLAVCLPFRIPFGTSMSVVFLGEYRFLPHEVIAIEPYGMIPILGRGIRIVHTKAGYPDTIVFWCIGSVSHLLTRIQSTGFLPEASQSQIVRRPDFPVRWRALLAVILVMHGAMLLDGFVPWRDHPRPGIFTLLFLAVSSSQSSCFRDPNSFRVSFSMRDMKSERSCRHYIYRVLSPASIVLLCDIQHFRMARLRTPNAGIIILPPLDLTILNSETTMPVDTDKNNSASRDGPSGWTGVSHLEDVAAAAHDPSIRIEITERRGRRSGARPRRSRGSSPTARSSTASRRGSGPSRTRSSPPTRWSGSSVTS